MEGIWNSILWCMLGNEARSSSDLYIVWERLDLREVIVGSSANVIFDNASRCLSKSRNFVIGFIL